MSNALAVFISDADNITLRRLIIDGSTLPAVLDSNGAQSGGVCVWFQGGNNLKVESCEIKNAITFGGIHANLGASNICIMDCDVHHNGTNDFCHGIYVANCTDVTVINCHVHDNAGWGIDIKRVDGGTMSNVFVVGNNVHNNDKAGNPYPTHRFRFTMTDSTYKVGVPIDPLMVNGVLVGYRVQLAPEFGGAIVDYYENTHYSFVWQEYYFFHDMSATPSTRSKGIMVTEGQNVLIYGNTIANEPYGLEFFDDPSITTDVANDPTAAGQNTFGSGIQGWAWRKYWDVGEQTSQ